MLSIVLSHSKSKIMSLVGKWQHSVDKKKLLLRPPAWTSPNAPPEISPLNLPLKPNPEISPRNLTLVTYPLDYTQELLRRPLRKPRQETFSENLRKPHQKTPLGDLLQRPYSIGFSHTFVSYLLGNNPNH